MARLPRIIVPGVPHHVTQRGNRRQKVFFEEEDYALYKDWLAAACQANGVMVWCYCLMPNHTHLILVPSDETGLSRAVGETHRRYSAYINARLRVTGHLFQGRFGSVAMDEAHLMAAFRYVAMNPVKAKLSATAVDWKWSSTLAHFRGKDDGLVVVKPLLDRVERLDEFLDMPANAELEAALAKGQSIGRPLMGDQALAELEKTLGRSLRPGKRGRPPSQSKGMDS
ncbi:transposase [Ectothiorhodospiraceae bacterium BW-2]|nr:transposase [Ectothiorhodospiraceae bacterium BW-2]